MFDHVPRRNGAGPPPVTPCFVAAAGAWQSALDFIKGFAPSLEFDRGGGLPAAKKRSPDPKST